MTDEMTGRQRIEATIALGPVDRVPVLPLAEVFAAKHSGFTMADVVRDPEISREAMARNFDEYGGWDAIAVPSVPINDLGYAFFGAAGRLPGYQLGENELWQMDEREVMQVEDYDFIRDHGWNAYITKVYPTLSYPVPPDRFMARLAEIAAAEDRNIRYWQDRGVAVYMGIGPGVGFDMISLTRSVKKSMTDIYRRPDAVVAAIEAMTAEQVPQAIASFKATREKTGGDPMAMMIASVRPTFLAPKYFEKFFWPYFKATVEQIVDAGLLITLHFDGDWTPYLEYFLELPTGKLVLQFDGLTDIFKAKEVLQGHLCLMGDVPASLLSLGSPDEVTAYCRKLIDVVGKDGGFILSSGCTVPVDAKPENLRAMIETGKSYYPHS
jgi:uroporphyrinogen-III decarboxylase